MIRYISAHNLGKIQSSENGWNNLMSGLIPLAIFSQVLFWKRLKQALLEPNPFLKSFWKWQTHQAVQVAQLVACLHSIPDVSGSTLAATIQKFVSQNLHQYLG